MTQQDRVEAEWQRLETANLDSQSLWIGRAILTLAEQVAIFNDDNEAQRARQESNERRMALPSSRSVSEAFVPPF